LLLKDGLARFRAPIESSETNTEASLSASPLGGFLRSEGLDLLSAEWLKSPVDKEIGLP